MDTGNLSGKMDPFIEGIIMMANVRGMENFIIPKTVV